MGPPAPSLALPPLANKSPILLSMISMSNDIEKLASCLEACRKIIDFVGQTFVVMGTMIAPPFLI